MCVSICLCVINPLLYSRTHLPSVAALPLYKTQYNTLQHTATHCNTLHSLQHTATHCNTLQHTATHCISLQHTATIFHALQHNDATHCSTLQHTATHCNTLQHTATRCNTLQHTATPTCQALQHCRHTAHPIPGVLFSSARFALRLCRPPVCVSMNE